MYRLLIADDEDHLRDLIVNQIDWKSLGFEVASARDGREALALAKEFQPEALLTDIRMPFIDGLELIQLLKKENPALFAIVLSGHDEFNYAKNSLKMGVTDYLLKPIRPQMLVDTMRELKAEMDTAAAKRADFDRIQLQLEESMPFLRQQYLLMAMHESQPEELILKQFQYLGVEVSGTAYALCLLAHTPPESPADKFFTFFAVQDILKKQFSENAVCFFDSDGTHYVLCGLSGEAQERAGMIGRLQSAVDSVGRQLSLTATASIGLDVAALSSLSQSLKSALAALDSQVTGGAGRVYDARDYLVQEENRFDFSFKTISDIVTKLPYEPPEVLRLKLDAMFEELRVQNCTDITCLRIVCADLINGAHKLLSEYDESADSINGEIYHELFSLRTLDELRALASLYILDVKEKVDAERKQKQQSLVGQAHAYIDEHFCDSSLSLSNVAQQYYVSPSYLSNLFKRKYDMNFVEYVTRLRMERAMELLQTTELKTYEIAEQVGYNDPQYFSNSFKKYTGTTPSKYKAANG